MDKKYCIKGFRRRLLEPEQCVFFCAKLKYDYTAEELNKAFRKLLVREPILTCAIELDENAEAYLVPEKGSCELTVSEQPAEAYIDSLRSYHFNFSHSLFGFCVIEGKTLVLSSHTAVCDVKGLAYLAGELAGYLSGSLVSVEPAPVRTIADARELPSKAVAPLTYKLSDSMNDKWEKHARTFTQEDYDELYESYSQKREKPECIISTINNKDTAVLKKISQASRIDLSSVLLTAFWESLERVHGEYIKAERYVSVSADLRHKLAVQLPQCAGSFTSAIEFKPPQQKHDREFLSRAVFLHKELYLKYTNEFFRFGGITFYLGLEPSLTDAVYFSAYDGLACKPAKNIAEKHGPLSRKAMSFELWNFDQRGWESLYGYSELRCSLPMYPEHDTSLVCTQFNGETTLRFYYRPSRLSTEKAEETVKTATAVIAALLM